MEKKVIRVNPNLHQRIDVLRARKGFRTFEGIVEMMVRKEESSSRKK